MTLLRPYGQCPPASSGQGFPRQENWSGLLFPSPGDCPDPGIEPTPPALAGIDRHSLPLSHHRNIEEEGLVNSICYLWAPWVVLVVKNIPDHAGDIRDDGWIHGSGRSREVGNGNPLHYSCLENLIDRGSLAGYSPWGHKQWDMNEHIAHICMLLIVLLFKEENKTRTQWSHTGARTHTHTHIHVYTYTKAL